ncbi:uncharacterized protein LOC110944623 [Helianthus annuus]|uniref:uncharacterized protein LOC110944623 n=1 Tax=Helianthus annuus TaxID=4232 RepID=UPI000B8F5FC0|nr:uncharacterized protein LOC110944623 [Helianthus annuus]
MEEISNHYPGNRDLIFSICFVDKNATEQSFIKLDSHDNLQLMLDMYEMEKELTVYATTNNNFATISNTQRGQDEVVNETHEEESEYSLSDESYHSRYSTDNEGELQSSEEEETYSKKTPTIKVNSTFDIVVVFRKALIQYAIKNEFQYFVEKSEPTRVTARCSNLKCKWRIHASVKQDGITFETFVEAHSCPRRNKGGNKLASQGWIASVIRDMLKSDGDIPLRFR